MNDDIVTRLRNSYGQGCTCFAHHSFECSCVGAQWVERYVDEAADEIEWLRAQAERWIVLCERAMAYQSGSDWQDIRIAYEIALNDYKTGRISG